MLDTLFALCRSSSALPVLGNLAMMGAAIALFVAPLRIRKEPPAHRPPPAVPPAGQT